jgi:hypothetical protein
MACGESRATSSSEAVTFFPLYLCGGRAWFQPGTDPHHLILGMDLRARR